MTTLTSFKIAAGVAAGTVLIKVSALAAALALLAAGPAHAGSLGRACTTAPQAQWLSLEALQAKVEALGYSVRNGKLKNACGEFYATDKTGARVELFVDPTDGKVVGKL